MHSRFTFKALTHEPFQVDDRLNLMKSLTICFDKVFMYMKFTVHFFIKHKSRHPVIFLFSFKNFGLP